MEGEPEQLEPTELQFRMLAEHATDVVVQATADGVVQWVSASITRVLGWAPADVVGQKVFELLHPDDVATAMDAQSRVAHHEVVRLEARIRTTDGEHRWMAVMLTPIVDADGIVIGRVAGWRDIDDDRRRRDALSAGETRFRLLAEHASDIVARTSLDGLVEWISPSVTAMLGWTPDELVGRPVLSLIEPYDHAASRAAQDAVLRGRSTTVDVRLARKAGGWKWMSARIHPLRDDDGRVIGRVAAWRDAEGQHHAQEALRQSEAQFRMLAENSSDVVVSLDNAGIMRWVSPSLTEQLGWSAEELIGRENSHLLHPDDLPVVRAAQERVLSGESGGFEARFLNRSGQYVWMSVAGRPVHDAVGNVVGRVAGWRNIDAERLAREQLRRSEEQLRLLVENASDVVVQQVEGVTQFVSPAITPMLGWRPDEFVGRLATEFWHPDDRASADDLRRAANEGAGGIRLLRMRHRDGSYRWIELVARPAPQPDGRRGAVGVLRDVTERIEAEERNAAARERDRVIAELSSDVYALFTPHGDVEWITGATADILGAPPEYWIGRNGREIFLTEDAEANLETRERLMRGEHVSGLVRVRRVDGTVRWIDRRSQALLDDEGNLVHFASAWRDAQHDVDLHDALAASERSATEANLAKTTFLSRMSHELRTPLNAVLGFAQLLDMDQLTPEQHESIAQILTGGRHLLELINEVLDIARIEAGRMSMSPEVVMASDVIGEALELVRPIAASAGVSLSGFDVASCREPVFVDRQRTIQVVLNLLTNGIKYNRPGGSVTVRCRHDSVDLVLIDVVDDGVGIAADHLPRLFQPFDRLGAEATEVEGTGIGLALSRGLAEMMGGGIEVQSVQGKGSTFTLALPRAAEAAAASPDGAPDAAPPLAPAATRLVLYVEDNPANAQLMRSIVARRSGVELHEAGTGAEAIESVLACRPDLVLLDLHLPDMRGEDVLQRLRSEPTTATVPVVVISADAGSDVRDRLRAMGADAFLPKPADVAAVLSWIDEPLQARGPR